MIRPVADRWLFFIAAAFNWLVAASFFALSDTVLPTLGMPPTADRLSFHLFLGSVAVFGLGYFWVGLDVTRNHAVVGMGVVGKLALFAVMLGHALAGTIPFGPLALAAVDVAFAALFIEFLVRTRKGAARLDPVSADPGSRWQ